MDILFIDDEPIRIQSIDKVQRKYVRCAHGMDQINYYLNHSGIDFDLICCDHDMPMLNGYEVCILYLRDKNIPVVVHSLNPSGAQRMIGALIDFAVPCINLPITTNSWWCKVNDWTVNYYGRQK